MSLYSFLVTYIINIRFADYYNTDVVHRGPAGHWRFSSFSLNYEFGGSDSNQSPFIQTDEKVGVDLCSTYFRLFLLAIGCQACNDVIGGIRAAEIL